MNTIRAALGVGIPMLVSGGVHASDKKKAPLILANLRGSQDVRVVFDCCDGQGSWGNEPRLNRLL